MEKALREMVSKTYHSQTPYFKKLFAFLGPLMDGDLEIEIYEELVRIR